MKDTALYVHEIAGLDWAFRAHRAVPLDEVAQVINDAGYAAADFRVTPAGLQHALVQAASLSRTRASGGDRAFTSIRVVRQLGALDHRDPARMRAAQITSLDPVQALLVVEDFTLPVYAAPGPQARHMARSALPTLTHGMVSFDGRWSRSAHICEKYKPLLKWAAGGFGSLVTSWVVKNVEIAKPVIGSVVGGSKKAGGWLSKSIKGVVVAKVILDAAHALAVGITVDLEYVRPPMPIKLGSAPVRFGAHVEQLYQWPKSLVKCGYLSGLHLPDKGPVPDIEVFWWTGRLGDFGTLTPAASSQVSAGKTGADGWSWLTFAPNPDPASSGSLTTGHGTAWALPSVNGSLQGGGAWLQNHAIDFFRINAMQWAVEYHLPTHLSVNMSLVEDYGWENSYGQSGGGSGNFQMTGGWQRQIGSWGLLDYSSAGETFDLHKASAVGGSCGASDRGVCDKHGALISTSPGMPLTVLDFQVDPLTGKPLRVELIGSWDPRPEEHLSVTCTGDCAPDASGTYDFSTAASILTGMYGLNSDTFRIVLTGWTKENGNWVLHQYWSSNEAESPPRFGYSRQSAVVTWSLTTLS